MHHCKADANGYCVLCRKFCDETETYPESPNWPPQATPDDLAYMRDHGGYHTIDIHFVPIP
jgi:hypothetical protein